MTIKSVINNFSGQSKLLEWAYRGILPALSYGAVEWAKRLEKLVTVQKLRQLIGWQ